MYPSWLVPTAHILLCGLALAVGARMIAATGPELDEFITESMEEAHIPGLAAGIVKDGTLVWARGYGWADVENQLPVTPDTVFAMASISKTVSATAVMQLWDDGLLGLDDDIDQYLRFPVDNPHHSDDPISFRQLLTHTSSIRDHPRLYDASYHPGDPMILLGTFVNDYLVPHGMRYRKRNYAKSAPGAEYEYSNIGFGLVGHLVAEISGRTFEEFTAERLFGPLGMASTGWHIADVDPDRLAVPYRWKGKKKGYKAYPQYGFPTYPDGGLRTSVNDFARYMAMHLADGRWNGGTILSGAAAVAMGTVQFPQIAPGQGLGFEVPDEGVLYHDGGDPGVSTEMLLLKPSGVGVVIMVNVELDDELEPILSRLVEEASLL
jgi:CubicO group peptidase (beta-lactamase class C family)